jgi:outer membrane protein assembly factor BamB
MKSTLRCWSLVIAVGVLFSSSFAQEWTRFRGPNGTGISDAKTIPVKWTEKDYNWQTALPAGGHASPVLWGDKIFLTCADDAKTAERIVLCLSAADGRILWSRKFVSTIHRKHQLNSFASATPAVDEERVYVAWSTPEEYTLLALDHDGKDVWRRNLGPFVSQHSCGTSPIVYEDLLIIGNDQDEVDKVDASQRGKSSLIAVDRKSGKTRWQLERKSIIVAYSTPYVYQPENGPAELIFNSQAHGITSVNPLDGRVNWEISSVSGAPLLTMRSVSSPVLAAGLLTISCGSGAGGNYLVAVRPGNTKLGREPQQVFRIEQRDGAPYVPTPIAKGDMLFVWSDKGIVSCVDARSGRLVWGPERVGGNFFGSPVCVDEKLYCISANGDVVVLAASDKYQKLATNKLGEFSHSTPAVAGGRMYVRTYKHLISIGGEKAGR